MQQPELMQRRASDARQWRATVDAQIEKGIEDRGNPEELRLRRRGDEWAHFRKGEAGGWRAHLTEEQGALVDAAARQQLRDAIEAGLRSTALRAERPTVHGAGDCRHPEFGSPRSGRGFGECLSYSSA